MACTQVAVLGESTIEITSCDWVMPVVIRQPQTAHVPHGVPNHDVAARCIVGCSIEPESPDTAMTDSSLELTPEEQDALERENKMMEVLRQATGNSGTSFGELLPNAFPVSELQYWAPIDRPDARARLKQALASGAEVNEKSDGDYTPLHGAAENGVLENVKLLIASGADVTAQLTDCKTPLDIAKAQGHAGVVEYLQSQIEK